MTLVVSRRFPMQRFAHRRPTILGIMALVAIAGLLFGLFAAHRRDPDAVAVFLLIAMVIMLPIHLAIEGNRRDAREGGRHREHDPAPRGPGVD